MDQKPGERLQHLSNIYKSLSIIFNIRWLDNIFNSELWRSSKQQPITQISKSRKRKWIGHALRKNDETITKQALDRNLYTCRYYLEEKAMLYKIKSISDRRNEDSIVKNMTKKVQWNLEWKLSKQAFFIFVRSTRVKHYYDDIKELEKTSCLQKLPVCPVFGSVRFHRITFKIKKHASRKKPKDMIYCMLTHMVITSIFCTCTIIFQHIYNHFKHSSWVVDLQHLMEWKVYFEWVCPADFLDFRVIVDTFQWDRKSVV